jgi:twitching motility protein PilT
MNIDPKSFNFPKIARIENFSGKIKLEEIMKISIRENASDIHLQANLPPILRINKRLFSVATDILSASDILALLAELTTQQQLAIFKEALDMDFSYNFQDIVRFRVNLFSEKDSFGAALRRIPLEIPSLEKLGLPEAVVKFANLNAGFVLITGPTGQGKSTTLAALTNKINRERDALIITIEDPIEYIFTNKKSVVLQREIGANTKSFAVALRAILREDPDVILIGELRDYETIATALTAAETGHLVFATLHTSSAAQSIDRIIDVFPPNQQQQVRGQLADVISGVVSQQLLERSDSGGLILAAEILIPTLAVKNLIRENKTFQIQALLQTTTENCMISMDRAIKALYLARKITRETALRHVHDPAEFARFNP